MYSLKVTPSQLKKITEAEYKKYKSIREMLKEYNSRKDDIKGMRNIGYAADEMKNFMKEYRKGLKFNQLDYIVSYETKNRVWNKMIGKIEWKFSVSSFNDRTILRNKRHEMFHKKAFLDSKSKIEWFKEMKQHIREKFQLARQKSRQLRTRRRQQGISALNRTISYDLCGGVIHNRLVIPLQRGESPKGRKAKGMGVYMRFIKTGDKRIVFDAKSPQTKDNYVGVELEFFCDLDREHLSDLLHEAGLGKYVCLQQDGSIHGDNGSHAHELTILAKEKDIYTVIKEVSDTLKAANAKVNKTCGMHVHLDMRNRDHEVAFHNLVSAQNVLFAMNPFSRQTGTYCRRVETKDFKKAASGGRYFGINAAAHAKHNTIEIRIHSGTIQENKVNNWIKLLMSVVNKKEVVASSATSLKAFIKQFDIDAKLAKYIFDRVAKFAGEDKKNAEEKGAA